MTKRKNVPRDNTAGPIKERIRVLLLPEDAKVLDLFCGEGHVYHRVYKGKVSKYHGVDKAKVHDTSLCTIEDNKRWIDMHGVEGWNVFDLDDHSSPMDLLFKIMVKTEEPRVTVFVTDGSYGYMRLNGFPSKMVSATNSIPRTMNIPAIVRWYNDIFLTELARVCERTGYTVTRLIVADNSVAAPQRTSTKYWGIVFEKLENS